jgi:SAM-dependent methyltransferase
MIKNIARKYISEKNRIRILEAVRKTRGLFLIGSKFYCVCCNKHFRRFLAHGNIPRNNARCPNCGSLERTRLTFYYLQHETDIFDEGKRILHFAPESMLEKRLKSIENNYISADLNPALADMVVDITSIQFPSNYFDYIICSHVLGHVPDEKEAIDEMYRVLKPGGRAIVLTLLNPELNNTFEDNSKKKPEERLAAYGEPDLVRLHGADFKERLSRPIGSVNRIDYRKNFSEHDRDKFSLGNGEREIIFDCKKL